MTLGMLSPIAMAQFTPPPLLILELKTNLINDNVDNVEVLFEKLTSPVQSATTYTVEHREGVGEIVVNSDLYFPDIKKGDTIRATLTSCADKLECVQTLTFDGQNDIWFIFDIGIKVTPVPEPEIVVETVKEYLRCDIDKQLTEAGEVYGPNECGTKVTAPPKTEPVYDWETFITGSGAVGLGALLYYLKEKYMPAKGKIKIERRVDRYGKPYVVIMKWSEYTRKDGTLGFKWILVQTIKGM